MDDSVIGKWAQRFRGNNNPSSLSHKVESVIFNRVVTKCGRQIMSTTAKGGLKFSDKPQTGWSACYQCSRV